MLHSQSILAELFSTKKIKNSLIAEQYCHKQHFAVSTSQNWVLIVGEVTFFVLLL